MGCLCFCVARLNVPFFLKQDFPQLIPVKAHGLNHIRFHSWCPPEAAFTAADECGVYLQIECASWANQGSSIGDGKPIDDYIIRESKRIVREFGNHPSFCMMAYGNEPAGKNQVSYLEEFVSYWKKTDSRRVYTGGAGWPLIEASDYHNSPDPRIQGWGEQLNSIINAKAPCSNYDWTNKMPPGDKPVVSHEIGQWCVYPDFKEIQKYTGAFKAKNFELFRESLTTNHMGYLADSFLLASGKLQSLCYKAEIEAALRTPGFAGFQLLDLHDFPGQGTALIGVLNAFWEEKGYISPQEYSRFCNSTRLPKHVFTEGESLKADIQVANFSNGKLTNIIPYWSLKNTKGKLIAEGNLGQQDIPLGNENILGTINFTFSKTGRPQQIKLEVDVAGFSNGWNIWVYPENMGKELYSEILVTENLDATAMDALRNGASVLLSLGKGKVRIGSGGEVGVGFSSIFWNTAWTGGQKPHTLGILCNPDHQALAEFPTEYHSNWQWWDAFSQADVINLNDFPVELNPIVQVIDDWVSNRRLALIFEARVGKGRLIVSGTDLTHNLDKRPEARQLLLSLKKYMASSMFSPTVTLAEDLIKVICRE